MVLLLSPKLPEKFVAPEDDEKFKRDMEDLVRTFAIAGADTAQGVVDLAKDFTPLGALDNYNQKILPKEFSLENISKVIGDFSQGQRSQVLPENLTPILPKDFQKKSLEDLTGIDVDVRPEADGPVQDFKNIGKGVASGVMDVVEGISRPETVATLATLGGASTLGKGGQLATTIGTAPFIPETAQAAAEEFTSSLEPDKPLGDQAENLTKAATNALFTTQMAKGVSRNAVPQNMLSGGFLPKDFVKNAMNTLSNKAGSVPGLPKEIKSNAQRVETKLSQVDAIKDAWDSVQPIFKEMKEAIRDSTKGNPGELNQKLKSEYVNQLKQRGVKDFNPSKVSTSNDWIDLVDNANMVLRNTGVDATPVLDLINSKSKQTHVREALSKDMDLTGLMKTLEKHKITPERAAELFEYVEALPDGNIVFNPKGVTKEINGEVVQNIKPYKGGKIDPEVLGQLFKLRQGYEGVYKRVKDSAPDPNKVGYLSRYLPREDLVPMMQSNGYTPDVYNPPIVKKRSWRNTKLQRDLVKLTNSYLNQAARTLTPEVTKAMQQVEGITLQLRFMGNNAWADLITKNVEKAFGYKDPAKIDAVRSEFIKNLTEEQIKTVREQLGLDIPKFDKIFSEIQSQMYHAWLGLNPKNLLAQYFQDFTGGGPELGGMNILKKKFTKFTPAELAELEIVRPYLSEADFNAYELGETFNNQGLPTKFDKVSDALKAPGKPGMYLQKVVDGMGRDVTYIVAREHYLKDPAKATATMTSLELQKIKNAEKLLGKEEAARQYGILKSQAIMGRFSNLNRAWNFKNGLGKVAPFMNYARAEAMKHYRNAIEVIGNKNPAHRVELIKRVAYPLALGSMFAMMKTLWSDDTDAGDVFYFVPAVGLARTLSPQILPSIGSTISQTLRFGPKAGIKTAMNSTAATKLLKDLGGPLLEIMSGNSSDKKQVPPAKFKSSKPTKFKSGGFKK